MVVTLAEDQKPMPINKYRLLNSLAYTSKKFQQELHRTKLARFFWTADIQLIEREDQSLMSLLIANGTLFSSEGSSQQK